MHFDELIKNIRAAAYKKGVKVLAKEAGMSDDTLRRILSDDPPEALKKLKRLEAACQEPVDA